MIDKKFEEKLKNLRELYLDKRPEKSAEEQAQALEAYTKLTDEEKATKLRHQLEKLSEKLVKLDEKLGELRAEKASKADISELKYYIDAVKNKKMILEQKLELIEGGEFDAARREKVKRQLTDLELKRCRALLSKKDCSKIDEKIALKKEAMKRLK